MPLVTPPYKNAVYLFRLLINLALHIEDIVKEQEFFVWFGERSEVDLPIIQKYRLVLSVE